MMTRMNRKIAGVVLAVSVLGGIGAGVAVDAATSSGDPAPPESSTSAASPTPDASSSTAPPRAGDLELAPGAIGPVEAGMSKQEALATGYFDADVTSSVDGCPARPLVWKDEDPLAFDVQTLGNGEITSIGIRSTKPRTVDGVGVGSTLDEVEAAYPDATLTEAGYGQSGIRIFDRQDGGWIGFLFDAAPDSIEGVDAVTFVEITKRAEPSLMRDGC